MPRLCLGLLPNRSVRASGLQVARAVNELQTNAQPRCVHAAAHAEKLLPQLRPIWSIRLACAGSGSNLIRQWQRCWGRTGWHWCRNASSWRAGSSALWSPWTWTQSWTCTLSEVKACGALGKEACAFA